MLMDSNAGWRTKQVNRTRPCWWTRMQDEGQNRLVVSLTRIDRRHCLQETNSKDLMTLSTATYMTVVGGENLGSDIDEWCGCSPTPQLRSRRRRRSHAFQFNPFINRRQTPCTLPWLNEHDVAQIRDESRGWREMIGECGRRSSMTFELPLENRRYEV